MRLGGIEAGGTKMICCVGNEHGEIEKAIQFQTTSPKENMETMISFFREEKVEAIGAAWFGPINLDEKSCDYGKIGNTPKLAWKEYNPKAELEAALAIPVAMTTDVNASLLGEWRWGAAKGVNNALYLTVGTGIGAGILVDGKLLYGLSHPEAGHMMVNRVEGDTYKGICPYHKNCLESMASGPAIEDRWKIKGNELPEDHAAWDLEADYLAQAIYSYFTIVSPEKIVLGGGVVKQRQLLSKIREKVVNYNSSYLEKINMESVQDLIVVESLDGKQAQMGCLFLASILLENKLAN